MYSIYLELSLIEILEVRRIRLEMTKCRFFILPLNNVKYEKEKVSMIYCHIMLLSNRF